MSKYVNAAYAAEKIAEKHGIRIADLCDTFGDIPAADVAPVVHGRWLNFYNDFTVAECDQCASQFEVTFDCEANGALWNGFKQFYKYCPNCGAKMDKEETDELDKREG